jgi:CheY-like chemotaxis protein
VLSFTDTEAATTYCLGRDIGVAIFVVDVFLGGASGFFFLDSIEKKFPTAHSDAIIITGNASDDIVNMCVASDVNHLLEKPIKPYALQLAVRAIAEKYLKFAKRLFKDPEFVKSIPNFFIRYRHLLGVWRVNLNHRYSIAVIEFSDLHR